MYDVDFGTMKDTSSDGVGIPMRDQTSEPQIFGICTKRSTVNVMRSAALKANRADCAQ